jgi:hypothetical protein
MNIKLLIYVGYQVLVVRCSLVNLLYTSRRLRKMYSKILHFLVVLFARVLMVDQVLPIFI